MVEKEEKIKETDVIEDKVEIEKSETEITEEEKTETTKKEITEEIELEDDPWSEENWKKTFPELFEDEKAVGLTKEDVVKIVRDQIKLWLKGVSSGKYPLPKGMAPTKYPYPKKKDISGLEEEFEEIRKSIDSIKLDSEKFDTLQKSLEDIKKEVQVIKDQPAEIIEKSIKEEEKEYKSPYKNLQDGTITR